MDYCRKRICVALALASVVTAATAEDSPASGREVYERHCQTCHGGTAPADSPIGPDLAGIVDKRAATQSSGLHSRALTNSGIVWNRDSLRRYLADPGLAVPGTVMPTRMSDAAELESLLDYLESLR